MEIFFRVYELNIPWLVELLVDKGVLLINSIHIEHACWPPTYIPLILVSSEEDIVFLVLLKIIWHSAFVMGFRFFTGLLLETWTTENS